MSSNIANVSGDILLISTKPSYAGTEIISESIFISAEKHLAGKNKKQNSAIPCKTVFFKMNLIRNHQLAITSTAPVIRTKIPIPIANWIPAIANPLPRPTEVRESSFIN